MEAATFGALGEPTRLRIVELLRGGPRSVGEIAELLGIRQPQASKHLRVLGESGIVKAEAVSRHRIYQLQSAVFEDLGEWLESYETLWDDRLDALDDYLKNTTKDTNDD